MEELLKRIQKFYLDENEILDKNPDIDRTKATFKFNELKEGLLKDIDSYEGKVDGKTLCRVRDYLVREPLLRTLESDQKDNKQLSISPSEIKFLNKNRIENIFRDKDSVLKELDSRDMIYKVAGEHPLGADCKFESKDPTTYNTLNNSKLPNLKAVVTEIS